MPYNHPWRVHVKNLESTIAVGVHLHERKPQRVLVNATVEGTYHAHPRNLKDCYNYEHIHNLVAVEWPKKEHTLLLEECVVELLTHIFHADKRVQFARVSVAKPDVFEHIESIGVEAEWTRADFEKFTPSQASE